MKSVLISVITIFNFNTYALNLFDLKNRSCEFFEEKFEFKSDETRNGKVILSLEGDSIFTCDENTFKLESALITVYDVEKIAEGSGDFTGLELFDIRKYKLLQKYPQAKKINDTTYEVIDKRDKLTFHMLSGKVLAISADWSRDFQEESRNHQEMSRKEQLASNLINLYKTRVRDISGYYQLEKDSVMLDNISVSKNGCRIEFTGTASNRRDSSAINFWMKYDFNIGVGWIKPKAHSGFTVMDEVGVDQGMSYNGSSERLSKITMYSSSDVLEATKIFSELHKLCYKK